MKVKKDMSKIEYFLSRLDGLTQEQPENYIGPLYDAVELIENEQNIGSIFENIFAFICLNRDADMGNPGPLVHLLEKHYPEYVPALISSLKGDPVYYTVAMLSRMLSRDKLREETYHEYVSILESVSGRTGCDEDAVELAKDVLSEYGIS